MNIINTKVKRLDETLIERFRKISPSELGHALEFGFMSNEISLLDKSKTVYAVGTAITARIPATDSTMVYKAMTYAKPGDILVIDMQGEKKHACWGEMTTLTAKRFGIQAVVVDGPNTDSAEIKENGFNVFSKGQSNLTTKIRGFKGDVNVPICCGGVVVMPGDLILANNDGIVVIPYDYADKLIEIAEMYYEYNEVDKAGFENNLPLTEIMSFEKKIEKMDDVIVLE
ncbi:MAG: RraA family protein [Lachnospiraceae bacterium]